MNTFEQLTEAELLAHFAMLVDRERTTTADLIRCIIEIDLRKLWAKAACSSMFAFVTERFHLSEAAAGKRVQVARTAQRFPVILDMLADGTIHMSAVLMLAAHLTQDNHREVLSRASHKTKRQIEELVAELAPKADVAARIVALPQRSANRDTERRTSTEVVVTESTGVQSTDEAPISEGLFEPGLVPKPVPSPPVLPSRPSIVVPLSPRRYKVEITVSEETRNKLAQLQDLLGHQETGRDPARVITRAIEELLERTLNKKAAIGSRPKAVTAKPNDAVSPAKEPTAGEPNVGEPQTRAAACFAAGSPSNDEPPQSRAIPAEIRREVYVRDGGRCAFQDSEGHRCQATTRVEFHHVWAFALGGAHTVSNIELRCRAHNQYEAELVYGPEFMRRKSRRTEVREPSCAT